MTRQTGLADRLTRRPILPTRMAFALNISVLVFLLAGSSAPTPLYAVYQREWGFSPITVTVVFGIYALAVLSALLVVGSLSDHVGRRPVLAVALVVQAGTMVVFATAVGVPELVAARVLQGLSIGAALGAIGAGLVDLDRTKGTLANGVAALAGTATGAIGSGLFVQYLPDPARLVYVVLLAVFLAQAVGVLFMAESGTRRPGALSSLRLELALPKAARPALLAAVPALVAVWALAGFYGSLAPSLVRLLAGSGSFVLGGLALSALAGSGSLTVLLVRDTAPNRVMLLGTAALAAGVGTTLAAISVGSTTAFFAGTVISGVGFGAAFQGALRTVVPLAAAHERAGVLSTLYVVSYLAMGLPAVAGGVLVVHGGGLLTTGREYGGAVIGLALLAMGALLWQGHRETGLDRVPDAAQAGDAGDLDGSLRQQETQEAAAGLPAPRAAYERGQVVALRSVPVGQAGVDGS
jgi:MFS family permease